MVLLEYKANTFRKAFILNAISAALISVFAIVFTNFIDEHSTDTSNVVSLIIVFVSTFAFAMITYVLLYIIFGFGGGMISSKKHIKF
jgi:threonine/homoserine/homoserine lactone efflux protein